MTKDEAREVLRLHNICRIHGTTMYEDKGSRIAYANALYASSWPYFYCPTCREEEAVLADVRIAEAKKVLGL